jgi:type VI secretion system protein ImpC
VGDDWVHFDGGEGAEQVPESAPFCVGVLADLSGGSPRTREIGFRGVDRDDLDSLLAEISPRVDLGLPGVPSLKFSSWDDFRPEGIVASSPALSALVEARDRVDDPQVVGELERSGALRPRESPGATTPTRATPESGAALLDEILGDSPSRSPAEPAADSDDPAFDRLIREIAEASAERTDYEALGRWQAAIDSELGRRLRNVLADPRFRALESAWRSLRDLVRHSETGESLRIRVLDVSRDAQIEDGLKPRLTDTSGGEPVNLLVVHASFGLAEEDRHRLATLGATAAQLRIGLVAGADDALVAAAAAGDLDADERWSELRAASWARYVALVGPPPRVRLPYGPDTDPVEGFEFDEVGTADDSDAGCLGNAAFLVARAAVQAVATGHSASDASRFARFDDLPFYVRRGPDATQLVGPTRRALSDAEIERMVAAGLIPLASDRSTGACQLLGLGPLAPDASSILA